MWIIVLFTAIILPLTVFKRKWIVRLWNKARRDYSAITTILKVFMEMKTVVKENRPVHERFEDIAKRYPDKAAILFEDETWTYRQIEELSNKVAIYFEQQGYKQGDCISLLLHNCPEYITIWLGLSKIGVITSLLNTNLGIDSLLHSIKIVNCKAIIFGSYFQDVIATSVIPELSLRGYQFNRFNESTSVLPDCINLTEELNATDPTQKLTKNYKIETVDSLMYIYTSGTTGLSKAAVITHLRYSLFRCLAKILFNDPSNVTIYCPMPLYHASGVALGMGQVILWGATVALRKKFSASNYWKDCKKYNCNVAQFIGEMLRYVLIATGDEIEKHSLDVMYGNGLKPQIWKQFTDKFNVKRIIEFYAATEGTFALYNVDNKEGTIGYVPNYLKRFIPFQLIRYSEETGEPIRDKNGLCIQCQANEPGLAIGKLNQGNSFAKVFGFKGYTDKKESSKKIIHNVFKKGDGFFNSGDLLVFDDEGYYYFVDRIGDTFRWKGENVSTTEIESIISKIIGLNDAVVYGVQIPGTEGRAGMVALVNSQDTFDVSSFLEKLKKAVPSYAIPIFIRVMGNVPLTSTFKLQKFNLRSEGFNLNVINDPLYFYDSQTGTYIPLTEQIYNQILAGKAKL